MNEFGPRLDEERRKVAAWGDADHSIGMVQTETVLKNPKGLDLERLTTELEIDGRFDQLCALAGRIEPVDQRLREMCPARQIGGIDPGHEFSNLGLFHVSSLDAPCNIATHTPHFEVWELSLCSLRVL